MRHGCAKHTYMIQHTQKHTQDTRVHTYTPSPTHHRTGDGHDFNDMVKRKKKKEKFWPNMRISSRMLMAVRATDECSRMKVSAREREREGVKENKASE